MKTSLKEMISEPISRTSFHLQIFGHKVNNLQPPTPWVSPTYAFLVPGKTHHGVLCKDTAQTLDHPKKSMEKRTQLVWNFSWKLQYLLKKSPCVVRYCSRRTLQSVKLQVWNVELKSFNPPKTRKANLWIFQLFYIEAVGKQQMKSQTPATFFFLEWDRIKLSTLLKYISCFLVWKNPSITCWNPLYLRPIHQLCRVERISQVHLMIKTGKKAPIGDTVVIHQKPQFVVDGSFVI